RLRLWQVPRRQVLNLRGIKHSVSLEERDRALDLGPGTVGLLADDAVGVDDGGTMLALPDMRAELHSLAVGHPQWGDVASVDGLGPKDQHVDPAVRNAVVPARNGDAGIARGPRLEPGTDAALKIGHDALGHACVKITALVGGGGGFHLLSPFEVGITSRRQRAVTELVRRLHGS